MQPIKRILLKLSGEALKGTQGYGLDVTFIRQLASKIITVHERGIQIVIVLWGGNIFRGATGAELGLDRTTGDYMGMIATIINGMALGNVVEQIGVPTRVMSSIEIPRVAELFINKRAEKHLEKWRIVICVAGTGNPYYTTDSAAVLRALELHCDILIKGTKVDGIYEKDPVKYPQAKRYDHLTYEKALQSDIGVMDHSAIALAKDEQLPLRVTHIDQIDKIGTLEMPGTLVGNE